MTVTQPRAFAIYAALLAAASAGCIQDVDRTQPDKVQKCVFTQGGCGGPVADNTPAEFYFGRTVIDVPSSDPSTIVGESADVERVVFEITEDTLFVYRSQPWLVADDPESGNPGDDYVPGSAAEGYGSGAAIAAFPIQSHFDVIRDYNPATGEQSNIIVENTTDRPWYEREYMRVNWGENLVSNNTWFGVARIKPIATVVTPQQDESRDLGKEATQISPDYIDFVQNWTIEGATLRGSEQYYGFPIPQCWLYTHQHVDCAGGTIKVRFSFKRVEDGHDYVPLNYDDRRMQKFGIFRTERYTTDDEYGLTEQGVVRLGHRWNLWKNWDCYDEGADRPYASCSPDNLRTIVYHVNDAFPAHLVDGAQQIATSWNDAFKEALVAGTGWDPAVLDDKVIFDICTHNPVKPGDPAYCGEPNESPQIGDLRYSFLYYVPEFHSWAPLGYGPSHADFITGEIFAGRAYFYGQMSRWIARRTLDIFLYDEGLIDGPTLGYGGTIRDRVGTITGEDIATKLIRQRGKLDLEKVQDSFDQLQIREKAANLKDMVQSGEAMFDPTPLRKAALQQSSLNQLLASFDEVQKGQSIATEEGMSLPAEMFNADQLLDDEMFWMFQAEQDRFASHRTHMMRADEVLEQMFLGFDERYVPLFEDLRERFMDADGNVDEDGAMDYIEAQMFVDTMLHEVGHNLNMRHNYAGSADALNFGKDWWMLRQDAGFLLNTGTFVLPEYLMEDPTAYDDAIRQGLRNKQSTAVMEYMSSYGTDTEMGVYEKALLKYVYMDTVEVFDTDNANVNIDAERAALLRPGALHYSFYPSLVSNAATFEERVDAMYARKHINYRKVDPAAGVIEVPYKFCSDEYVGGSPECDRWDQGADNYERTIKKISDYRNYYWLDAFKRERLGFGASPFGFVSALYQRTFKPLTNQYKHFVNEEFIVRSGEPCVFYMNGQRFEHPERIFAQPVATDIASQLAPLACGLHGYAAASDALNLLAEVIATPNVGCYARLENGCYDAPAGAGMDGGMTDRNDIALLDADPAACDALTPGAGRTLLKVTEDSAFRHLGDSTSCPVDGDGDIDFAVLDKDTGEVISRPALEVPLGVGKPARTVYDRGQYGYYFYYKPTVMGSWWEKWMAVKALYDHNTNFIGVDASADTASYLISIASLFGADVDNIVAAAVGESGTTYGPKVQDGKVVTPMAVPLFVGDQSRFDIDAPSLDPDQEYTFRLTAMMNAAYQSASVADTFTFAEGLRVERCFSSSCLEIPDDIKNDPARYVEVTDPVTAEVWYAIQPIRPLGANADVSAYAPGFDLLRRVKHEYYEGGFEGPGTQLRAGVNAALPRGEFRFLNIMRGVYRVFAYGEAWSGDINL